VDVGHKGPETLFGLASECYKVVDLLRVLISTHIGRFVRLTHNFQLIPCCCFVWKVREKQFPGLLVDRLGPLHEHHPGLVDPLRQRVSKDVNLCNDKGLTCKADRVAGDRLFFRLHQR
jgi:hypothetical protein